MITAGSVVLELAMEVSNDGATPAPSSPPTGAVTILGVEITRVTGKAHAEAIMSNSGSRGQVR